MEHVPSNKGQESGLKPTVTGEYANYPLVFQTANLIHVNKRHTEFLSKMCNPDLKLQYFIDWDDIPFVERSDLRKPGYADAFSIGLRTGFEYLPSKPLGFQNLFILGRSVKGENPETKKIRVGIEEIALGLTKLYKDITSRCNETKPEVELEESLKRGLIIGILEEAGLNDVNESYIENVFGKIDVTARLIPSHRVGRDEIAHIVADILSFSTLRSAEDTVNTFLAYHLLKTISIEVTFHTERNSISDILYFKKDQHEILGLLNFHNAENLEKMTVYYYGNDTTPQHWSRKHKEKLYGKDWMKLNDTIEKDFASVQLQAVKTMHRILKEQRDVHAPFYRTCLSFIDIISKNVTMNKLIATGFDYREVSGSMYLASGVSEIKLYTFDYPNKEIYVLDRNQHYLLDRHDPLYEVMYDVMQRYSILNADPSIYMEEAFKALQRRETILSASRYFARGWNKKKEQVEFQYDTVLVLDNHQPEVKFVEPTDTTVSVDDLRKNIGM